MNSNIGFSPPWTPACASTVNQPWAVAQASKQANELAQRTKDQRQQTPASMSDTFMNNVHPSCGTDNESVDLAGALALLSSNILDPCGAAHPDNRVNVKDLLKKLKTVLTFGSPSTIVAALCLLSTSKFADRKLSGEVVEDTLKKSFGEHQGSDCRMPLTAVSSSRRFKAWCAAAGFDVTSVTNQETAQQQRAQIFNEFEDLSLLCASQDMFDGEIAHKHATNGSDVDFLKKKFRQTFRAVMGPAKNIQLMNVPGPPPAQRRLFLEVTLCECPRLVHVDLSRNEAITDATLQPFAALHDTLEYLYVGMSAGFWGSLEPLRILHKMRELYLYGCVALEGNVEPLSGLQALQMVDLEACFRQVGRLDLLSAVPQLQFVNVCDTQLDAASFVAERQLVLQLSGGRWRRKREVRWWWAAAGSGGMGTKRRSCGVPRVMGSWRQRGGCWPGGMVGEACSTTSTNCRREQGREGVGDTALRRQPLRPQGRGGDASRRSRRRDGGVAWLDRTVGCAWFGPP